MNDKNKIILFLIFLSSLTTHGSPSDEEIAPIEWFTPIEHQEDFSDLENHEKEPSKHFTDQVDEILQTHAQTFDLIHEHHQKTEPERNKTPKGWHLNQLSFDLGLTAQGKIGILSLGGTSWILTNWFKKEQKKKEVEITLEDQDQPQVNFQHIPTPQEIDVLTEKLSDSLLRTKKIKDKESKKRFKKELSSLIQETNNMVRLIPYHAEHGWEVSRFRLYTEVQASGQVLPMISVGANVRFMFDWNITFNKKNISPKNSTPHEENATKTLHSLIGTMIKEIGETLENSPLVDTDYKPITFQIGLGVLAGGNFIGIAKGRVEVLGELFFQKIPAQALPVKQANEIEKTDEHFYLIADEIHEKEKTFIERHKIFFSKHWIKEKNKESHLIKLERKNFKKGLEKALKMSAFFAKHAKRNPSKHWHLRDFRTDFIMSISGVVSAATLAGEAVARITFQDKNW